MLSFVLWLVGTSAHTLQRAQPIAKQNPFKNVSWVLCGLVAIASQVRTGTCFPPVVIVFAIF